MISICIVLYLDIIQFFHSCKDTPDLNNVIVSLYVHIFANEISFQMVHKSAIGQHIYFIIIQFYEHLNATKENFFD